jgi:hypothetical protein
VEGERLDTHAPNLWKWLSRSVGNNNRKADRVLAALFMVLANRYDWQLFLEVTGPGVVVRAFSRKYAQCWRKSQHGFSWYEGAWRIRGIVRWWLVTR